MLRIIRGFDNYTPAASPDEIGDALRHATPGRYDVEALSQAGQLLPSGRSCCRWGTAIRHPDGQLTLDPNPWPE